MSDPSNVEFAPNPQEETQSPTIKTGIPKMPSVNSVIPRELSNAEIVAQTFEEAEARHKDFSDDLIIKMLDHNLVGPDGTKVFTVKSYFDKVMPDVSERQSSQVPETLARMHAELAQMIIDNLRVWSRNLPESEKAYISDRRKAYIGRLENGKEIWTQFIRKWAAGDKTADGALESELAGFTLNTGKGPVDISELGGEKIKNIRPNIRVQRDLSGQFVHWETDQLSHAKLIGQEVSLTRRIYLNPKSSEAVKIFTELMHLLNERGLTVSGKVLNRSAELSKQTRKQTSAPIRADAIVLNISQADADNVLQMVLEMYRNSPETFAHRPTPKIPTQIAPGIALGDEPIEEGESLTSHRSAVISDAIETTRSRLGIKNLDRVDDSQKHHAIKSFRSIFSEKAKAKGINPNNLAFNL